MPVIPLRRAQPSETQIGAVTKFHVNQIGYIIQDSATDLGTDRSKFFGGVVSLPGLRDGYENPFHWLISSVVVRVAINPYWSELEALGNGWERLPISILELLILDKSDVDPALVVFRDYSNDISGSDDSGNSKAALFEQKISRCERVAEVGFPPREQGTVPSDNDYRGVPYSVSGADYDRTQTGLSDRYPYRFDNPFDRIAPTLLKEVVDVQSVNSRELVLQRVNSDEERFSKRILSPLESLTYFVAAPLLYVPSSTQVDIRPNNYFGLEIDVAGMYSRSLDELIPYV